MPHPPAPACGGFDPTTLCSVSAPVRSDRLAVLQLIARTGEDPAASGHGDAFAALVRRWRPGVAQRQR